MVVGWRHLTSVDAASPSCTASTFMMVMNSSIMDVARVVLQLHHQHRPRGWTLSTETGDSLLLAGRAALEVRLDGDMRIDGARVPGTSEVGVVSQPRALGDPRARSCRVNVLSV